MSPQVADAFHDLVRAWDNWTPFILNYFNHPVTNAYTESLNSLIRVMNRLGRGYSFEALRAKILFAEGAHKVVKPKFERRAANSRDYAMVGLMSRMTPDHGWGISTEPAKNYGADISTLVRLIEAGAL